MPTRLPRTVGVPAITPEQVRAASRGVHLPWTPEQEAFLNRQPRSLRGDRVLMLELHRDRPDVDWDVYPARRRAGYPNPGPASDDLPF